MRHSAQDSRVSCAMPALFSETAISVMVMILFIAFGNAASRHAMAPLSVDARLANVAMALLHASKHMSGTPRSLTKAGTVEGRSRIGA